MQLHSADEEMEGCTSILQLLFRSYSPNNSNNNRKKSCEINGIPKQLMIIGIIKSAKASN